MISIFAASIIFSIWCVTLFFDKSLGLSVLLFVAPITYFLIKILEKSKRIKNPKAKFFMIPIVLLSSTYFIFDNGFFYVVNIFVIPILIAIMILSLFKESFCFNFEYAWNFKYVASNFCRCRCDIAYDYEYA